MRNSLALLCIAIIGQAMIAASPSLRAEDGVLRYRGAYTYGHEVHSFCPEINSQCYWIGGTTQPALAATLKQLSTTSLTSPYEAICMVIAGRIDRNTERTGFAANYDGLISVTRLFGKCDETDIVTQGDLQHHRWILNSINGEPLHSDGTIPELDFGERMTVTGNTGCNQLSNRATLREQYFVIEHLASTPRSCSPHEIEVERIVRAVLGKESTIRLDSERNLTLQSAQTVLQFRLEDWKR